MPGTLSNDFNMGELLDHVPIARQHDPDIAPGTQRTGQGGRHGGKPAHPDEIVHLRGDKENLHSVLVTRTVHVAMQDRVQFSLPEMRTAKGRRLAGGFPARRAQTRVSPRAERRRGGSVTTMTIEGQGEGHLTGSFAGLRVLDFSTTIAGPHCTRMLADTGAEVIKIETSEGETMRTRPPVRNLCSTVFGQLNIGKNSVVLDLKSPAGVEAVRRLVATADVLVENFRPGVMRRLKLDHASLREANPKLIYCSISGYGQTGPSAELPAYAPVI